jgi:hypothetical protein
MFEGYRDFSARRGVSLARRASMAALALLSCVPVFGGFAATEVYLPAVGRVAGAGDPPSQFYTTTWISNLTGATVHFSFQFLKQGQANPAPQTFNDTLAPGQTKLYENVVETKLGLSSAIGAARITADGEIFAAERIYNQFQGDPLESSVGLFFSGVPGDFAIGLGQSATIQGVNQGGSEDFRYNFALVETAGMTATAHVSILDADGSTLGSKDYLLGPYEQIQPNVSDVVPAISTINARVTATVTAGAGRILLAGAQLANQSQDPSGFEMSFRGSLLSGGGGVTSLNGLTGAVTLAAGSNITITPAGNTLTIAAAGGGGGLALPFSSSISIAGPAFEVTNGSSGPALEGNGNAYGLLGKQGSPSPSSLNDAGVVGESDLNVGVEGWSNTGIALLGFNSSGGNPAVKGINSAGDAVVGLQGGGTGSSPSFHSGVWGDSNGGAGVYGSSATGHGVFAASNGTGIAGSAVYADDSPGIAIVGHSNSTDSTVVATNEDLSGDLFRGFGGPGGSTYAFEVKSDGTVNAHGTVNAGGIDYADRLPGSEDLAPGDVLAIGPDGLLRRSTRPDETDVVGVYSTRPGVAGQDESYGGATVPVALAGVIPVKVTSENGEIRPGDLLVSSSTPGFAMRAPENPRPGTVLGKAMDSLDSGSGRIQMLVMLR